MSVRSHETRVAAGVAYADAHTVAFGPDGRMLAVGNSDGTASPWDAG